MAAKGHDAQRFVSKNIYNWGRTGYLLLGGRSIDAIETLLRSLIFARARTNVVLISTHGERRRSQDGIARKSRTPAELWATGGDARNSNEFSGISQSEGFK